MKSKQKTKNKFLALASILVGTCMVVFLFLLVNGKILNPDPPIPVEIDNYLVQHKEKAISPQVIVLPELIIKAPRPHYHPYSRVKIVPAPCQNGKKWIVGFYGTADHVIGYRSVILNCPKSR